MHLKPVAHLSPAFSCRGESFACLVSLSSSLVCFELEVGRVEAQVGGGDKGGSEYC